MTFEERIRKHQKSTDEHRWPKMNLGHLMASILEIHTAEEAKEFREGYIGWTAAMTGSTDPPEHVVDMNIGWCFGEGMPEKYRAMWRKLGASHPVFGDMKTDPTPEEALSAGFNLGKER